MTPERRHDEHPHPPPGCPEQRKCSDTECREARDLWFTEVLLPKLMIRFWVGITLCVGALSGVFFYMQSTALTAHELKLVSLFETTLAHDKDVARLDVMVSQGQAEVVHSLNKLIDRVDRNLSEIQEIKKSR